jgi:dipeptide/tripeptide permease
MLNVFSSFSVPQLTRLARRTALSAVLIGIVAVVVSATVGYALTGVGVCIGLTMALANFRMISRATVKASASAQENKRRPLVMNTLGRLGVITVIALGLVLVSRELGFGALVGLAILQFTLLANVTISLVRDPGSILHDTGSMLGGPGTLAPNAGDDE